MAHQYNIGDVVLGNWKLIRLLGEGSFGKVFEAHRDEFGTIYKSAIKIITIPYSQSEIFNARAEGMDDESIRNYFQEMVAEVVQEFALMSKLKGTAHIVSYEDHAVIPHEDSIDWDILIRMELLTPMLNYVSEHQLSRKAIVKMGIDICKALELCQRNNIIHRDIKPENMFISNMGDFKLGDFGVARTLEKTTGGLSKKGTYTYMSPEVYREDAYGQNVDIYSLGIVMYRLLNNNRSPFLPMPPHNISHSDRELALIRRMSGEALPQPANASGKLAEIVLKACAYDPKERYATASQMRRELEMLIRSSNLEPAALKQRADKEGQEELTQTRRANHSVQKSGAAGSYSTHQDRATQDEVTYRTSRTERTARENTQGRFQKAPEQTKEQPASKRIKKKKHSKAPVILLCIAALVMLVFGGMFVASRLGKKESVSLPEMQDTKPQDISVSTATTEGTASVVDLKTIVTEADIGELEQYTNLKTLDLSGSTCYEVIRTYQQNHPDVDVTYTVEVGNMKIGNKNTEVSLLPADFSYDLLIKNLQYLPKLESIAFEELNLNGSQIMQLCNTYPDIKLDYEVYLFGKKVDLANAYLDLSEMSEDQVEEAVHKLGLLTNLTTVQLSDSLSLSSVAKLQDANTNATFKYNFRLFGEQLSTETEQVEFKDLSIGNEEEKELRQAMAVLDKCTRFVLDGCNMDNQILADIRDDFRDGPYLVWRVRFGVDNRYTTLTDDDCIRAVYNLTDDTVYNMRYCEKVKYIDIGHNEALTDFSFFRYMPELEAVIASGCGVRDISCFENCKNLTWLEMAYCDNVMDISSLQNCESLKYLNIASTSVSDILCLGQLNLERFVALNTPISNDARNKFRAEHPDCIFVYEGYENPYGYGWRYDDNGKTMFWYYKDVIRKVFNYDQADAVIN